MEENISQTLTVDNQKKLSMTGVVSVDSFNDESITISLTSGRMVVNGEGMKIAAFSKTTGSLNIDGKIFSVKFQHQKQPIIKRLFK